MAAAVWWGPSGRVAVARRDSSSWPSGWSLVWGNLRRVATGRARPPGRPTAADLKPLSLPPLL